jgi:hypothetical protein
MRMGSGAYEGPYSLPVALRGGRRHLEKVPDGFAITRIDLGTRVTAPGVDESAFREGAEAAKEGCPVSQALAAVGDDRPGRAHPDCGIPPCFAAGATAERTCPPPSGTQNSARGAVALRLELPADRRGDPGRGGRGRSRGEMSGPVTPVAMSFRPSRRPIRADAVGSGTRGAGAWCDEHRE